MNEIPRKLGMTPLPGRSTQQDGPVLGERVIAQGMDRAVGAHLDGWQGAAFTTAGNTNTSVTLIRNRSALAIPVQIDCGFVAWEGDRVPDAKAPVVPFFRFRREGAVATHTWQPRDQPAA